MSEWSGFYYVSANPLSTFARQAKAEKEWQRPANSPRSNSASHDIKSNSDRTRRPLRYTRTSSGSRGSSSSHESSLVQHSSSSPNPKNGPALGEDDSHYSHSKVLPSSDSRLKSSAAATTSILDRPLINTSLPSRGATPLASPIIFNRPVLFDKTRQRDPRRQSDTITPTSSSVDLKNVTMYSQLEAGNKLLSGTTKQINLDFPRAESVSSASGTISTHTMTSTDPSNSSDPASKPFIVQNGRTYFNDPTSSYPLPTDLAELHRQSLRTLLMIQVYGAPVYTPFIRNNPPLRVLEVGCGTGFWSMMCHRYYRERGHGGIHFTGIDIAPLAPGSPGSPAELCKPDKDMKWRFVQHDLRQLPWPFADEEFDMIMVKDTFLMVPSHVYQLFIEEYLRVLKPGGVMEIWDSDPTFRMLRPHVPSALPGSEEAEEHEAALDLGAYLMTSKTPLSAPLNSFLVEYNTWLSRTLEARQLSPVPCSLISAFLHQEAEVIMEIKTKRLAIPLSEVRWEREGVGGVVTKDGKSYVEMKAKSTPHQKVEKKTLTPGQSALRKTALLTVAQQVSALEPIIREASGKSQDEWDTWVAKMMADLMSESGTSWGECLELGVWSARKRQHKS
ncbi:sam-containing protein [Fusarium heterosporum]|uniref:Sam-containing protein n=1 Tax=Fusarium heterosporum TaxID=42747 RepID=A0A8H5WHT1_FUSHE|nr:sam-containing protein [Fusarium heterosporum]